MCCPEAGRKHLAGSPACPRGGRPWTSSSLEACGALLWAGLVSPRPPQPGPVPPPLLEISSNGSYKNSTWLLTPVAWGSWRSHVP